MMELRVWLDRALQSTAFHEAGHTVAAALLQLPLLEGGMHIDMEGSGVTHYCHRLPGSLGQSDVDQIERENTVIALYAGRIAQSKFCPECDDPEAWKNDWATADKLLREMGPAGATLIQHALYERAERIVFQNWHAVESLANALWAKPQVQMQRSEYELGWSRAKRRYEKWLKGDEIKALLTDLNIMSAVVSEAEASRLDPDT
jgi:hypothetical protein